MTQNPTEKGTPQQEKEPEWITDLSAGAGTGIYFTVTTFEQVSELCEGENIHCELCGEKFPLWPPRLLASHSNVAHAEDYTMQHAMAMSALMQGGLSEQHGFYIHAQMAMRVSVRRRAWKLGYAKEAIAIATDGGKLFGPNNERLQ